MIIESVKSTTKDTAKDTKQRWPDTLCTVLVQLSVISTALYPNNLLTIQNCVMSSHTLLDTASLYHLDIVHNIITLSLLPVTTARRKVQTAGNCFEWFVIVNKQSHWDPHQDDGWWYALFMLLVKIRNNQSHSHIEHLLDTGDEFKSIVARICRHNGKQESSQLEKKTIQCQSQMIWIWQSEVLSGSQYWNSNFELN